MRIAMTLLALSLSLGVTACKKKTADDTATGTGSALAGSALDAGDAAGSADPGATDAAAGTDDQMTKKAGNCPSTVAGATTTATIAGKDIVLTITADDKDAVASIQRRTAELLAEKADAPTGASHDQKGSQGGAKGICPVYFGEGGTATSKVDPKGVTVTITPKDKPEELKATIDERITKSADWVKANVKDGEAGTSGGVGGGGGDHGGNHSGSGDGKGKEREGGTGGGMGTGGGGSKGTGGGSAGSATK